MKAQDEDEVQKYIDDAGEEEREEWAFAVAPAAQDGGGEVVDEEEGISQQIDLQIQGGERKNFLRRIDEGKERIGDDKAQGHADKSQQDG